jgi:fructokinase
MNYQVVCFGEILFDVLGDVSKPGGAPFNVAYHLKQSGIDSFLISSVGNDVYGEKLLGIVKDWGLDRRGIEISTSYQTGVAVVRHDENNQPEYELVCPVAWDHIPWKEEYSSIIHQTGAFVFGSLSARSEDSYNTLKKCLSHSPLNVFDINIRPPYFDKPLIEHLLSKADILKLNDAELILLSEWYGFKDNYEKDQVTAIREQFDIAEVVVTKGEKGASYYSDAVEWHEDAIKVNVADTIGSGDAFLAGFLSKRLDKSCSIEECLKEGSRRGAFVASKYGACPSYETYVI